MNRRALLVIPLALLLACDSKSAIERAVALVPDAVALVNAFEAVTGVTSPTGQILEHVKRGLANFETVARDYLARPDATGFANVIKAADAFVGDFDTLFPTLDPKYKAVAVAADVALHFIKMVVDSAAPPAATSTRAQGRRTPPHVDQAALESFARQHKMERYLR